MMITVMKGTKENSWMKEISSDCHSTCINHLDTFTHSSEYSTGEFVSFSFFFCSSHQKNVKRV